MIGCRLNQSEIEILARQFNAAGHDLVADPANADLAVVNTCTVTSAAAADSRKIIRRIARSGVKNIVSTGCWSELYPEQALDLPGVARVVSNAEKAYLVSDLLRLDPVEFDKEPLQRVKIPGSRLRTRAFIKAQDGCRHHCTFCITTVARGDSRSESTETVLKEINAAVQAGFKEVVLTGVQLGSWGKNFTPVQGLHDLVPTIVTGGNDHLCARVLYLPCLFTAVKDPLLFIGHGPGTPSSTAAEVVHLGRIHFHIVLTTLLGDPTGFFKIAVTKSFKALTAIIAGVMHGRQLLMDRLV